MCAAPRSQGDEPPATGRYGTARGEATLPRKLIAEFVGTYFLTLVSAGIEVVAIVEPGHIDRVVKAGAPAMIVAAMIYTLGDISGAHFNPVVTTAFSLRRAFPARLVPAYWTAQLSGAVAAALSLRSLFGTTADVGTNHLVGLTSSRGLAVEALLTTMLVFVIINAAHRHSLIGTEAALAVGATLAVCAMLGGELTTASMNPARSIGPAIVATDDSQLWLFVAGPFIGALVAVGLASVLRPNANAGERIAAQGDRIV